MPLRRPVAIANQHPRLTLHRAPLVRLVAALDARFRVAPSDLRHLTRRPAGAGSPVPAGELSLVFLTDAALAALHGTFLDDPTATDVITFAGDPAHGLAGEICVSVDAAAAYARRHRRDFSTELALYVIHGWLHLAGYDDLTPARKRVMRRAEARAQGLISSLADSREVFAWKSRDRRETSSP